MGGPRAWWGMARFGTMNALLVIGIASLVAGGSCPWAALGLTVFLATLGDEAAGDDLGLAGGRYRRFYDANLFLTLPLMLLNAGLFAAVATDGDPFGMWAGLKVLGLDMEVLRARHDAWSITGACLGLGLSFGAAATNVAHELVHRTTDPTALATGRWLLAFTFDTAFSIEHVYGHHRYVGTLRDPATARRGEYVLAFAVRSTLGQIASALRFERERLARKRLRFWTRHNRFLNGQLMSLTLVAGAFAFGGLWAVALFVACAVQGKLYLELVNYIEHYGLVRAPGSSIEARHSWNSYRSLSSALLYNLPRHSHHHLFATKPFWMLETEPDAPTLPFGYKTMLLIALVPPLWHRLIDPRLADWDARLASDAERAILATQGRLSAGAAVPA